MTNWKDELKAMLGLPLLWLFAIGCGYVLIFLDQHYWVWLAIFIVPTVLGIAWALIKHKLKKKSS